MTSSLGVSLLPGSFRWIFDRLNLRTNNVVYITTVCRALQALVTSELYVVLTLRDV